MEKKMSKSDEIKQVVKEKYGEIAANNSSCCGPTSCCGTNTKVIDYSIMQDDYTGMDGYVAGAGCLTGFVIGPNINIISLPFI